MHSAWKWLLIVNYVLLLFLGLIAVQSAYEYCREKEKGTGYRYEVTFVTQSKQGATVTIDDVHCILEKLSQEKDLHSVLHVYLAYGDVIVHREVTIMMGENIAPSLMLGKDVIGEAEDQSIRLLNDDYAISDIYPPEITGGYDTRCCVTYNYLSDVSRKCLEEELLEVFPFGVNISFASDKKPDEILPDYFSSVSDILDFRVVSSSKDHNYQTWLYKKLSLYCTVGILIFGLFILYISLQIEIMWRRSEIRIRMAFGFDHYNFLIMFIKEKFLYIAISIIPSWAIYAFSTLVGNENYYIFPGGIVGGLLYAIYCIAIMILSVLIQLTMIIPQGRRALG